MKPTKKACEMSVKELGRYIDQSVLKPEFTIDEVRKYIQEGIDYGCKTVCINPAYVDLAKEMCAGTDTEVCPVCDFPFGSSSTASRVAQAELIIKDGGITELDIVCNYGHIRSGIYDEVYNDIKAVSDVCHKYGVKLKAIMETDALTLEQAKKTTEVLVNAGADFVKTSTGFLTGHELHGATVEIIGEIIKIVDGRCSVKGSGSIREREHFLALIDMGIDRMGIGYKSTATVLGLSNSEGDKNY